MSNNEFMGIWPNEREADEMRADRLTVAYEALRVRAEKAEAECDVLRGFVSALMDKWYDGMYSDIDGGDFQDLLVKHGFLEEAIITADECKEDWAMEWDYRPGDPYYRKTDLAKGLK